EDLHVAGRAVEKRPAQDLVVALAVIVDDGGFHAVVLHAGPEGGELTVVAVNGLDNLVHRLRRPDVSGLGGRQMMNAAGEEKDGKWKMVNGKCEETPPLRLSIFHFPFSIFHRSQLFIEDLAELLADFGYLRFI